MPMEKRAICAPKSVPLFLHSNEEVTCPATTHLLAPLAMRYGHVTNFSPPGCEKWCVWLPGLFNKLPQQVHSSMFHSPFLWARMEMKTTRVPWKLLSEDDREIVGLSPWKTVWSKPSTPLSSSKLLIQIVMGERTFVVFQTLYFGSFCYTSYPKHYGKHSFTLSPPSRHIFSECRNIMSMKYNGEWWTRQTPVLAIMTFIFWLLLQLQFVILFTLPLFLSEY